MSQEKRILEYLKQGNSISPLESLNKFGCFRLAAVIHKLRGQGFNIENTGDNNFAVYKLASGSMAKKQELYFVKGQAQIDLGT